MNKTNAGLACFLLMLSLIAVRIKHHVDHTKREAEQYQAVLDQQSRWAEIDRERHAIPAKWAELQRNMKSYVALLPPVASADSKDAAAPTGSAANASDSNTSKMDLARVLREPLDGERIAFLTSRLDPAKDTLPARVRVLESAVPEWVEFRLRFPAPLLSSELRTLDQQRTAPQKLLRGMDPQYAEHRDTVRQWAMGERLHYQDYLDWLGTENHKPMNDRAQLANIGTGRLLRSFFDNPSSSSTQNETQLRTAIGRTSTATSHSDSTLAMISGLNKSTLWDYFARSSRGIRNVDEIRRIWNFEYWHRQRIGSGSDYLTRTLEQHPGLPADLKTDETKRDEKRTRAEMMLVAGERGPAIEALMNQIDLLHGDYRGQQTLCFDTMLMEVPDPLRFRIYLRMARTAMSSGHAPPIMLASQFGDTGNVQFLKSIASHPRSDEYSVAAAIRTLCRRNARELDEVVNYWMTKSNWPRGIEKAFIEGGEPTQFAISRALLQVGVALPPPGTASALLVLSKFSTPVTRRTLDALEAKVADHGTAYFLSERLKRARSAINSTKTAPNSTKTAPTRSGGMF